MTWWATFRAWPSWAQAAAWLAAACIVVASAAADGSSPDGETPAAAAAEPTTTASTEQRTGGRSRADDGGDRATGVEVDDQHDDDAVVRAPATPALLAALAALAVEPEHDRSGYDRGLFRHWDDEDGDGCDTRCEVLTAQRRPDGSWLSEWEGYVAADPSELHVDHVVALAEAWDSGADRWSADDRDAFADWRPNLLAVTAAMNVAKGDADAATWFPARAEANCLWASTVVRVKAHWDLAVDEAERAALGNLLRTCPDAPPTTTTTTTTTTAPPPPPPPSTAAVQPVAPAAAGACTPGYDPCIAPGPDVDCAGGSGNGPRFVGGPVAVDPAGGDPYDLDADGDGTGCDP